MNQQHKLEQIQSTLQDHSQTPSDGRWFETLVVESAPLIPEWDIAECHAWADWPDREQHFPGSSRQDLGIDAVGIRNDGGLIAIQCKAHHIPEEGTPQQVNKGEVDSFAHAASGTQWSERWIVVNGDVPLASTIQRSGALTGHSLTSINMANVLQKSIDMLRSPEGDRHQEVHVGSLVSKQAMQDEAVQTAVRILNEHVETDSGGLPAGQARGKIILPCGTGKTRISLRVVEELTEPGEVSVVLCPSIALVAQIRREYLSHATRPIRAMAVCSDQTAAYDPKKEGTAARNTATDPTLDNSLTPASAVQGTVTTNPQEIADWIVKGQSQDCLSVVFGTYQSGRALADGIAKTGKGVQVLVCDEAHRTAGLRRKRTRKSTQATDEAEQRIRDFTLCHDQAAFPATFRIYQTATPRIYDTASTKKAQTTEWYVRSMDDETVFGVELYRKSYVEAVENGWLADYRIIAVGVQGDDANRLANDLARAEGSKKVRGLSTTGYLRGLALALAMGGAIPTDKGQEVNLRSCIAFMNTVAKSKRMANDLQLKPVQEYVQERLAQHRPDETASTYTLEHLDASSKVVERDAAKRKLSTGTVEKPFGILNVGIFGEGTDSPSPPLRGRFPGTAEVTH